MIDGMLRRLLTSPFLRHARVERDARGRVSAVRATLEAGEGADGGGGGPPERPLPEGDERALLADAARWLDAAALRDARAFALGEERAYAFDQETGALTLRHADGTSLALPGRILGSFRPQDGSFRWAWANPGVAPGAARAALAVRDRMAAASFHTPSFRTSYAESRSLAALAARLGGCDGAYRAVTTGQLSMFIGYTRPSTRPPPVAPSPEATGPVTEPEALAEAMALVGRHDAAMLPHDVEAQARGAAFDPEDGEARGRVLEEALAGKLAVYKRFWHRDDAYWEPCSVDWPSPHDPAKQRRRFAVPRRAGGAYVVTQFRYRTDALAVERVGDEWRITDRDLDWGRGLPLLDGDELAATDATPTPSA